MFWPASRQWNNLYKINISLLQGTMVVQSACAQSANLAELIAKHGGNPKSQINKTKPNRQNAIQPRDLTSVGVVKCNMEIWFDIVSFH